MQGSKVRTIKIKYEVCTEILFYEESTLKSFIL